MPNTGWPGARSNGVLVSIRSNVATNAASIAIVTAIAKGTMGVRWLFRSLLMRDLHSNVETLSGLDGSPGDRTWRFARSGRDEQVRVRGNLRANHSETLREAALADLGLILMPTWLIGADLGQGRQGQKSPRLRLARTSRSSCDISKVNFQIGMGVCFMLSRSPGL